ncbi:epoxyqueuosine reductase [Planctomicrobium piriforme]|uniref:4Fe-4S ferredoxin-type domain-containing protein n=1 Tax=Planctomicrobium piriforme TaxID=1576369 RepID=A0A1I3B7Q2_9PLAN|nr:SCP2 sterol-binding domain-containing protein [Planctomicrobium piriforme]SFH57999.1 hypothetical protein SAMN05421753_101272 [Planctomicrobium piriforme]
MSKLDDHPTVRQMRTRSDMPFPSPLDLAELRAIVLAAGADDVGFVEIDRAALESEKSPAEACLSGTRTLISFVVKMNRDPIRSPERSVSNLEFHHTGEQVNDVGRKVVRELQDRGYRAVNPAMGFPMEMDRYPGRIWVISHKPVAVEAGLGRMGIHRNVIHPRFGNFILLGTILTDIELNEYSRPIEYNPCLECKLCVAACPVGAISADGHFDFTACHTHNYREFNGGFTNWIESIADSSSRFEYRKRVTDGESASMWQSLAFGANYKAAYCLAVCPAGEDVISPFLSDRKGFLGDVLRPLQDKKEPVYVIPGSDAEDFVRKKYPHKELRKVPNSLRVTSVASFLRGMSLNFQREQATGLNAVYHFTFSGRETRQATVIIRDKSLQVHDGVLLERPDLVVTADAAAWIGFLRKERSLLWALLTRRIRLAGSPKWLLKFGRCFPA